MSRIRKGIVVSALAGLGCAVWLLLPAAPLPAQPASPAAARAEEAPKLPLAKAVLFSSGVGYFQREGDVAGDARIDLAFPVRDINDLLKSLVVQDLGGGKVSAVSLDSADPLDRTLKSFALDLSQNPTLGELLHQAHGESVEVVLPPNSASPGTFVGVIISLENRFAAVGNEAVETERLNLMTAKGMKSLPLEQIENFTFKNARLDQEFRSALAALARTHDSQKKNLSLSFKGQGQRKVRVGYVVEHPIWKTSYRLVLDPAGKPLLQGWALVENPTDEDWTNVRLSLVAGRPISFSMNLHDPLYIERPKVKPELFAGLQPPSHDAAMETPDDDGKKLAMQTPRLRPHGMGRSFADMERMGVGMMGMGGGMGGMGGGMMGMGGGGMGMGGGGMAGQTWSNMQNRRASRWGQPAMPAFAEPETNEEMQPGQGVETAATGQELGEHFQYVIAEPVTLGRQKSALVPIVSEPIEATRLSIYNAAVLGKHPLLSLKLKNTTGLHLTQGPLTVFEAGAYAGDAKLGDLEPGAERFVSFAVDLRCEVKADHADLPETLSKVTVAKGTMRRTMKEQRATYYHVKNRDAQPRLLVVEHPWREGWTIVGQQPAESSRDLHRFELKLAAGASALFEVKEEKSLPSEIILAPSVSTAFYEEQLRADAAGLKLKEALKKAIELRQSHADVARERGEAEQRLKDLRENQGLARENLKVLPNNSAAYRRFLEKIDNTETEIEKTQERIEKLKAEERAKRNVLEAFLNNLTAD